MNEYTEITKANSSYWEILKGRIKLGDMTKLDADKSFRKYLKNKNSTIPNGTITLNPKDVSKFYL